MDTKIAIIGSGISGLAAAYALQPHSRISLYEAGSYFGGHTHTVNVNLPTASGSASFGIDTGFLVFNERTYPHLIKLFADLNVATSPSDMSFSVQTSTNKGRLEWSGSNLDTVFAQRANLLKPGFWRMLRDLIRFNKITTHMAQTLMQAQDTSQANQTHQDARMMQALASFLQEHRFSNEFRDWYLLPMLGCIWSCPTAQMLQFPVATMIRFCHNHGLFYKSTTAPSGALSQEARSITSRKSLQKFTTNVLTHPFVAL